MNYASIRGRATAASDSVVAEHQPRATHGHGQPELALIETSSGGNKKSHNQVSATYRSGPLGSNAGWSSRQAEKAEKADTPISRKSRISPFPSTAAPRHQRVCYVNLFTKTGLRMSGSSSRQRFQSPVSGVCFVDVVSVA